MKTKQFILASSLLFLVCSEMAAQSFLPGFKMFSHKKTAYLVLADGSKVEGFVDKVGRSKNYISSVVIKNDDGEKEYMPAEISEMYLPVNDLNKFSLKLENATNMSKDYDLDLINEGYGFFENAEVNTGKETQTLMMQLANPGFDSKIKVYIDPNAIETGKASFGPISSGGVDRSYYLQYGEITTASKFSKADYKKGFLDLFASCPSLLEKIGSKGDWDDFAVHVMEFNNCTE